MQLCGQRSGHAQRNLRSRYAAVHFTKTAGCLRDVIQITFFQIAGTPGHGAACGPRLRSRANREGNRSLKANASSEVR